MSGHRLQGVSGHRCQSWVLLPVFGLVFFGGVQGVFGDDFSGVSVDDDGVVGVDEDEDGLVFVGSADA